MAIQLSMDIRVTGADTAAAEINRVTDEITNSGRASEALSAQLGTNFNSSIAAARRGQNAANTTANAVKGTMAMMSNLATNLASSTNFSEVQSAMGGFFDDFAQRMSSTTGGVDGLFASISMLGNAFMGLQIIRFLDNILNRIGSIISGLGTIMSTSMSGWEEKANEAEARVLTFGFNIGATALRMKRDVGEAKVEWTSFVNELSKGSIVKKTDLMLLTEQMVRVGAEAKVSSGTIKVLTKGISEFAPKGNLADFAMRTGAAIMTGAADLWDKYGVNLEKANMQMNSFVKQNKINVMSLTDSQVKTLRMAMILDFLSTQQGKLNVTMQTYEGIQKVIVNREEMIAQKLGTHGSLVKALMRWYSEFLDEVSKLPAPLLYVTGVAWNFLAIILKITGAIIAAIIPISGIILAYIGLTGVLNTSTIAQGLATRASAAASAALGTQAIMVTGAATAWTAFQVAAVGAMHKIGVAALSASKSILVMTASLFSLSTVSAIFVGIRTAILRFAVAIIVATKASIAFAIANAVIIAKITIVVGVLAGIAAGFVYLEKRTKVFSTLWKSLEPILKKVTDIFKEMITKMLPSLTSLLKSFEPIIMIIVKSFAVLIATVVGETARGIVIILEAVSALMDLQSALGLNTEQSKKLRVVVSDLSTAFRNMANTSVNFANEEIKTLTDSQQNLHAQTRNNTSSTNEYTEATNALIAQLKEAHVNLSDLEKMFAKAEGSGDRFFSLIAKQKLIAGQQVVQDLAMKQGEGDAEKIKELGNEAVKNAEQISTELKNGIATINALDMQSEIKRALEARDYNLALKLEIEGDAEINKLKGSIQNLQGAPGFEDSAEVAQRIEQMNQEILLRQQKLQDKYMQMEKEFGQKKIEATTESNNKILEATGDLHGQLIAAKEAAIAEEDLKLKQGLINEETAIAAKKAIGEKYIQDVLAMEREKNIKVLEESQALLEQQGKQRDPILDMQKKAQEVQSSQAWQNASDIEKEAVSTQQLIEMNMQKLGDTVGKYLGEMKNTILTNTDIGVPTEIFSTLNDLAHGYLQVGQGIDTGTASVNEATKKMGTAMKSYSKQMKDAIKERRDEGKFTDADKLQKDWEEFEGKIQAEILPKIKEIAEEIAKNSAVNVSTEGIEDVGPKFQQKFIIPQKKGLDDLDRTYSKTQEKIEEFKDRTLSVFDTIDLRSAEGMTDAVGDLLANFEKISPGKVFGQVLIKAFDNPQMREVALNMGEKAATQFGKGMSSGNVVDIVSGFGKSIVAGFMKSLGKANVWVAIFEFFNKDVNQFRQEMAKKINEFMSMFERFADNIPTFIVSIAANIIPILNNLAASIIKLFFSLISMIPVLITRVFVEAAKSFANLPDLIGDFWDQGISQMEQAGKEFYYGFYHVFSRLMSGMTRLVTMWTSVLFERIRAIWKMNEPGFLNITNEILGGTADLALGHMEKLQSFFGQGVNVGAYVGSIRVVSGATKVLIQVLDKTKRSYTEMTVGAMDMVTGMAIAYAKESEQAAEWAYGLIVVTTIVKAAIALLNKDWLGAVAIFGAGMASATSVIDTYAKGAGDRMDDEYLYATEKSEKWMAREAATLKKQEALRRRLSDTKRSGSDEFKVKDVEDTANMAVKDYSLQTLDAVRQANEEFGAKFEDPALDLKGLEEMKNIISAITGSVEGMILTMGLTLAIALLPLSVVAAIWVAAITVFIVAWYLIKKYWDDIVGFFEDVGDWFADFFDSLGLLDGLENMGDSIAEGASSLGNAIGDGAADLWDYASSGDMFDDIGEGSKELWDYISTGKLLTDLDSAFTNVDENILQPAWQAMKTAFSWVDDNVLSPAWEGIKSAFSWVYDNIIKPILEAYKAVFTWIYDNILAPAWELMKKAFSWVYDNILAPAWEGIKSAFSWVYDNIIKPILEAYKAVFTWIDDNIISPAIEAVKAAFVWIDDNVIAPIVEAFKKVFKWVDTEIFSPITKTIKSIFTFAESVFKSFIDGVKAPFEWIYDNIIKPIVNFGGGAKNVVYKAGDKLAEAFSFNAHGGVIQAFSHGGSVAATAFAAGGRVPGLAAGGDNFGRDTVPAMLSPGEIVLPNSVTANGDLMRDIGRLLLGDSQSPASISNVINSDSKTENTYNVSINVSGSARMSRSDVEREILPAILDGIKEATSRGRAVVNSKGVY